MCFRESHISLIQQTPPARHTVYEASVLGECTVLLRAAKSPGRGTIYMTQSSEECVVATTTSFADYEHLLWDQGRCGPCLPWELMK